MGKRTLRTDWCTVQPASGNKTQWVDVTVEANTGRRQRRVVFNFVAAGGSQATAQIQQNGSNGFVEFDKVSFNMLETDTQIVVTGKSNAKKLTFTVSGPRQNAEPTSPSDPTDTIHNVDPFVLEPVEYTVLLNDGSELTTANGAEIEDDPGVGETYIFSAALPLKPGYELTYNAEQCQVSVSNDEDFDTCMIVRTSDPWVKVNGKELETLNFSQGSETRKIQVSSNTSWTVTEES